MTERRIVLSDQLDDFVEASFSSGRYASASEVVSAALHLLEGEEDARKLQQLREAVEVGLRDLEEGRSRLVSSDELEGCIKNLGPGIGRADRRQRAG